MAAKKQKPALYELVNKGNLATPGWFYRSKKAALEKLRQDGGGVKDTAAGENSVQGADGKVSSVAKQLSIGHTKTTVSGGSNISPAGSVAKSTRACGIADNVGKVVASAVTTSGSDALTHVGNVPGNVAGGSRNNAGQSAGRVGSVCPVGTVGKGALQVAFARLSSGGLSLRLPFWCAGLVILALVAMLLTAYWLGQNSIINRIKANKVSANVQLEKLRNGKITPGLVPSASISHAVNIGNMGNVDNKISLKAGVKADKKSLKTNKNTQFSAGNNTKNSINNDVNSGLPGHEGGVSAAGVGLVSACAAGATGIAGVAGQVVNPQRLIICGAGSADVLAVVRDYFNSKGLPTAIGKFGSRYVLVTREVFSRNSPEKAKLLQKIARIGAGYNRDKKSGDPVFNISTFKGPNGPFAVSVKKVH